MRRRVISCQQTEWIQGVVVVVVVVGEGGGGGSVVAVAS